MKRAGALLQSITLLVLTACASDDDVVAGDDTPVVGLQTVLEFEGTVDDGVITLRAIGVAQAAREQALTVIGEDRNGARGTAVATDLVELTSENGNGSVAGNVVDGCGVGANGFDVFAGVRSFHTQRLQNLHLQIIETSGGADNALCNSDRASANIVVDGAPLSSTLGLIRYGSLAPDTNGPGTAPTTIVPLPFGADATARARRLRFRTTTGTFSFRGRILADVCSDPRCAPGAAFVAAADVETRPAFIDTDGDVLAVAEGNGIAWLGGTFSRAGRRTGAAFRADATTTGAAKPWPSFEGGVVNAITVDAANNVYVGGTFTHVDGVLRPRLVKITAAGVVDTTFVPPVAVTSTDGVSALTIDTVDGRLWIGRTASPFLAVVLTSSGSSVALSLVQPNNQVHAIAIGGNDAFIGGQFTNYNGSGGNKIAKLVRSTGAPVAGFPGLLANLSATTSHAVRALAISGTTVFAVGEFTGTLRQRAAAFDIASGTFTAWGPFFNGGTPQALVIEGSTAWVGGSFTSVLASLVTTTAPLVALNTTNGDARGFAPVLAGGDATVRSLAIRGSQLIVGGSFTSIAGQPRARLASVTKTDTIVTPAVAAFDPAPGGGPAPSVNALAVVGTDVVAGGAFGLGGGAPRSKLAAVNIATGELTSANVVVTGTSVNALLQRAGQLFIGGSFTNVAGGARTNVAVIDAGTLALTGFADAANDVVNAFAVDGNDRVYVGGAFTSFGGPRSRLARLSASTTLETGYAGTAAQTVNALGATADGVLVGSGLGVVRLNDAGQVQATLAPSASGVVRSIVVAADRRNAWVGGTFTALAGAPRVNLAKVNLATTTVDPAFVRASIAGGGVFALDVDGAALVVGGAFTAPRNRLAFVDIDSGNLLNAEPLSGVATDVRAVRQTGTVVVAGGTFGSGALLDVVGLDGGARRSSVAAFFGEGEAETPGSEPVPSSGCGRPRPAPYLVGNSARIFVVVDGRTRDARVKLPTNYDPSRPWPVIFAFHGDQECAVLGPPPTCAAAPPLPAGLDAIDIDNKVATEAITIHIDGESLNRFAPNFSWDTISGPTATPPAPKNPDIAAILAFQEKLRGDLCTDDTRTFAGGFSGGGFLMHALACYGVPKLKAVGAFTGGFENGVPGGAANIFDTSLCGVAQNIVVIHNTADPRVSFATWGQPAVALWRTKAGCTATTTPDLGISTCTAFVGCSSADVTVCRPVGSNHDVQPDGANAFAAFIRRYF